MARITRAASHLSAEEVKTRLKLDPRPLYRQRWLIIYNALVDPRKAADIARHTGTSKSQVHQTIATYNRLGVEGVETPGKGGRRHQYLTLEEEHTFLAPFFTRASAGEITTVGEIKHAFETQVGHEVNKSTIYRLLGRHGWRKLAPRPVHPQANKDEREAFKKTLPRPSRWLSPHGPQRIADPCSRWHRMKDALVESVSRNVPGLRQACVPTCPSKWFVNRATSMQRLLQKRAS